MEEQNKVNVKIYGQEFTISGDQPRDHIMKIADHVDRNMHRLSGLLPSCSVSALAILTAVNTADDYFQLLAKIEGTSQQNRQLEKDIQHYVQLWEEAKRNFLQYKEDAQNASEQREELRKQLSEKTFFAKDLSASHQELKESYETLQKKYEDLLAKLQAEREDKELLHALIKEAEGRCKEIEDVYFELQMENVRLKAEKEKQEPSG